MELLVDNNLVKPTRVKSLMHERDEILAMIVVSAKTARLNHNASPVGKSES